MKLLNGHTAAQVSTPERPCGGRDREVQLNRGDNTSKTKLWQQKLVWIPRIIRGTSSGGTPTRGDERRSVWLIAEERELSTS